MALLRWCIYKSSKAYIDELLHALSETIRLQSWGSGVVCTHIEHSCVTTSMNHSCESRRDMDREKIPLLPKENQNGLSLFFATLCIVDIFGVFPIIALPRAIVLCGERENDVF